jgi:putative tricarboxylic transport membrane protein
MDIIAGFAALFGDPMALAMVVCGAVIGVVVGAIPGLTTAAAISMLVPLTFYIPPLPALAFLYVMGKSGRFGGSISAILFNTPGTAASAATMIDGHPLVRQGKSGKAMKTATVASVIGDFGGDLILIFGVALIARYTEKLGPPEYFAAYLMAFVLIGSMIGNSIIKGLISSVAGVMLGIVGLDPISAMPRLTFGSFDLEGGFSLVPILIGVFVLSEVFVRAEERGQETPEAVASTEGPGRDDHRLTLPEFLTCLPVILRSTGIGAAIGLLPGLGSAVACFIAYGEEKRRAPDKETWGSGNIKGIAAPESANNAVSGPSMIPLLALGIPGSTIAAILVSVFLIHGITVGPAIFNQDRDLVFGLFAAGLMGIAIYGLIGYFAGPLVGRFVALLPASRIYPLVFLTAFIAAYSARNSMLDVLAMACFGLLGYAMKKLDFSPAALIISFVLTRGAEESLRQAMLISDNGPLIFLERPFAIGCFAVTLILLYLRLRRRG